ncbi:MAG: oligosaccharide flippase family protein [Alkalinema sp. RU_4_3]|nr:oligosaccharide flippase family protein [Alkalinema sp. RU_4_3]
MDNLRLLLAKLRQGELFRNSQMLFNSFFLRLIVQSVYFVVLARTFGPDKYGAFIATIAIISLFIPFANLGSSRVLIQHVSRDQSLCAEYYGASILKTLFFGSALTATILLIFSSYPIPYISIDSVLLLAVSNLIFMPLSDNGRDAFIGLGLLGQSSKIILSLSINRFLGILALVTLFKPTLLIWSVLYCVATLVTAIVSYVMVFRQIGYPKFKVARTFQRLGQGVSFSISDAAENIYNDLDKTMLAKLSTVESVAVYGAAYHILNVSLLPMQSLMLATFRDFFRAGAFGIQTALQLGRKILPILFGYSILAVALIFLMSPLIPKILGDGYLNSAIALMWLSPTILFKSLHRLAADILTGANYQRIRSFAQVLTALLNGVLNLFLIRIYQWRGAIWATLISEILLMLFLWGAVYAYYTRDKKKLI